MTPLAPCELCGADRYELLIRGVRGRPSGEVFRCLDCGLVFLASEARPEEIGARYRADYRYVPNYHRSGELLALVPPPNVLKRRVQAVAPFVTKQSRVLEIGCGVGSFLSAVSPLVAEAVGIELNHEQAREAETTGCRVFTDPVEELDFGGNFDAVCIYQTFEHCPAPLKTLQAIHRALKKGGLLFVEVPNVEDALLAVYHVPEFAPFYYRDTHLFYYGPRTLERMLAAGGFRGSVESVQQYSFTNHLHWLYCGAPQSSLADGMSLALPWRDQEGVKSNRLPVEVEAFWVQVGEQYRHLLEKSGYGDTLWCRAVKAEHV